MQELLIGTLLVLAIVWLVVRIRNGKAESAAARSKATKTATGSFHAVAIKYSENACDAAKAMTGRRFLSSAAPKLPLPECDRMECRCTFTHFKDRRTGRDRRSPFAPAGSTGTTGSYEAERRDRPDRRRDDDDDVIW